MNTRSLLSAALLATAFFAASPVAHSEGVDRGIAPAVDVEAYSRSDSFHQVKISPTGEFLAATVPLENGERTALVIIRRGDSAVSASFSLGRNTHIHAFDWVNPERVLISIADKFGSRDEPLPTGELYAINVDGSKGELLVGQRVAGAGLGTRIQPKKVETVAAFLVDGLPTDDRNVVISVSPFHEDPYSRAELMDVYSGRRMQIARAPVRNAQFVTDHQGVVRFALGLGTDYRQRLYYRDGDGSEWELLNDEGTSGVGEAPVGFSADGTTAYLQVEHSQGPDSIVSLDTATGRRTEVLRDDAVDPAAILHGADRVPVGVVYQDGKPRTAFFDDASTDARLYRSLEAAFDSPVVVTSRTADGNHALVQTWSDRNPGDFYLFDTVAKKAAHLLSRREWFDPAMMAAKRPVEFKARDGLALRGYVTVPKGAEDRRLPMVVMPHGGPYGVQDTWDFDPHVQMLAAAGYAVLQVNFRGSGGYGKAFTSAGAREWGKAMQDDVTDATHWAIRQGIADPGKVCIYGASYGAYGALMGAAREPDLYQCAAGYVGVYDLPTMHTQGDIQRRGSGATYLREWIGEREELDAVSPTRMADQIKVPVFLAAGGEDERAPIQHTRMMERALVESGSPVETLYYPREGHGFYVEEHQREYHTRLLAFLARSLGGGVAAE